MEVLGHFYLIINVSSALEGCLALFFHIVIEIICDPIREITPFLFQIELSDTEDY